MPRIPAVSPGEAGPMGRLAYRFARRRYGKVLEPMAVMRHHRGVFRASVVHESIVQSAVKSLPAALADLVQYRVATVLGCSWCVDFGAMLIRHAGLDTERLAAIDDYRTSPAFDDTERLALAYADAVTATPPTATDEQVAELADRLGRAGVVELTYLIALENSRSRFNHALGIVDQGFSASCAVPPVTRTAAPEAAG